MKKLKLIVTSIICVASILSSTVSASTEYSWYCKREKNHQTPKMPSEFEFINNYNAYSYDKEHVSYDDAEKVIYLTFDAGYENGNVEKTLDILSKKNVKAAFFVLGNLIESNTELVKRMASEGHLVCNHTYSHKNMCNASKESLLKELNKLEESYQKNTGKSMPKYYRPPEGRFSKENLEILSAEGYKTIFWSFAYADWDNSKQPEKEKALNKLKDNLHNGEIMLLHPTSATNAAILEDFIDYAKSEGFRFASLDELK